MDHAEGGVAQALGLLRARPRYAANFIAVEELPERPARHGNWPHELSPALVETAGRLGFTRPFSHQAAAVEASLSGKDVVLASGTASGKSLAYVVPALHALEARPGSRALMLFPTKALARDQLAALERWDAAWPELALEPATYDGDTPARARAQARRRARIVLTNPDMLHVGMLPRHQEWSELMSGLALVVIDEAHVYRGVFGSHVANVIRRLRRVARFHGADPLFVLTSATIGNPRDLAEALIGRPVTLVHDDGSAACARTLVLYNPPVVDRRLGIRRSALLEAVALARRFVDAGVQTIVFAQSRQAAELMVRYMSGAPGSDDRSGAAVRGYRAGYLPGQRREIEQELRSGRLRAVVATSALELGVDIGDLGASVIAGYPGSIASLRQQAGRAGRRTGHGAAILVAGAAPIDQYLMRHPEFLLGGSPEQARINPDNLLVLLDHLRCAAYELPFGDVEACTPFGNAEAAAPSGQGESLGAPAVGDLLSVLADRGDVRHTARTWYWIGSPSPAQSVSLRSTGPDAVTVTVSDGDGAHGSGHTGSSAESAAPTEGADLLATVERSAAATTVHAGAIYLHDGAAYEVLGLDWEAGRAIVRPSDGSEYTRACSRTDLRPEKVADCRAATGARVHHGDLEVRRRVTSYRRIRFRTHETVGWGRVQLPEQVHVAGGYWFTLDDAAVDSLRRLGHWQFDASSERGPDWAEQRARVLERDGRRCRLCNAAEQPGRDHDVHHIRPFRDFGWIRGENDRHREANDPGNLITLCRRCHAVAERALGLHGALGGLAHALRHMAALYLMCDARDLEVGSEAHAPWTGRPTVAAFERSAGGLGLGPALFDRHEELLRACRDLIDGCSCAVGCPSCVGPVEESGPDAKAHALAVLQVLGAGDAGPIA